MYIIFLRCLITYVLLLIIMRLMGKRQIGEMQPFELVITLVISELACIPMADVSLPLVFGIVSIMTLFILHHILSLLTRKSITLRKVLCGRPTVVITPNGIDYENLKKLSLSISDLLELIRSSGYFSFNDVEYGVFETNGNFSVLEKIKSNAEQKKQETLPLTLIEEGKIIKSTFEACNITRKWLDEWLKTASITNLKNVIVATIDEKGEMFVQEKTCVPKIIKTNLQTVR